VTLGRRIRPGDSFLAGRRTPFTLPGTAGRGQVCGAGGLGGWFQTANSGTYFSDLSRHYFGEEYSPFPPRTSCVPVCSHGRNLKSGRGALVVSTFDQVGNMCAVDQSAAIDFGQSFRGGSEAAVRNDGAGIALVEWRPCNHFHDRVVPHAIRIPFGLNGNPPPFPSDQEINSLIA
jgi:hypothetical protein